MEFKSDFCLVFPGQVLPEHRHIWEGPGPGSAAAPVPPAAPHRHPEGSRDVSDVPRPAALETHGRILPQHPERGAGEGVHRAVRPGVRHHLSQEGGGEGGGEDGGR